MDQLSITDVLEADTSLFVNKLAVRSNYTLTGIHDILHRNEEIKQYYIYLKDIFHSVAPNNLFVYGKAGTGKSILSRWVLYEVLKEAMNRNIELCIININCEVTRTENAIWQVINDNMPIPTNTKRKKIGNSASKHGLYFQDLLNKYNGILIIVLDEIDKAVDPAMINKIIRMKSETSGQTPTIIGITNDLYIESRFPPHLLSVLAQHELIMNPYDAEELIDIITARAKIAFKPDVVSPTAIALCAALSAQEHGEARRAIDLLRVSGEIAEIRHGFIVEEEDVRQAVEQVEFERVSNVIQNLPTQSKIILVATIYMHNRQAECSTNNIYSVYKALCRDLDIDVLSWRRMVELLDELGQLGIVDINVQHHGRYGHKKIIESIKTKNLILPILVNDYRLTSIKDKPQSRYFSLFKMAFE